MEAIKKPQFQVLYNSKDISKDISKSLISVSYSDAEEGETDEIQIELEDTDGLWRDAWYPQKKDSIELSIGYDGVLMYCGKFVIDEVSLRGAPDTVTIRGLAAAINSPLRSKNSTAHEKQTLKQIAEKIAAKNGLTVSGEIGNIQIARVTQNRETDLAFLARVAKDYGYLFSVRDKNLIFTSIYNLEKGQPVLDIDRTDLISYSVTDKSVKTFKAATVKYREPKTNKVVSATVKAGDPLEGGDGVVGGATSTTADDEMLITDKAENEQQARLKAQAALHRANTTGQDGNFDLYGEPLFVAGNNFLLTGMGALSGRWHISKSTHTISRGGGYVTSLEAKRLKDVEKPEEKKTPTKKKRRTRYKVKSGGGAGGLRSLDSDRV
jgi:phage protein D